MRDQLVQPDSILRGETLFVCDGIGISRTLT